VRQARGVDQDQPERPVLDELLRQPRQVLAEAPQALGLAGRAQEREGLVQPVFHAWTIGPSRERIETGETRRRARGAGAARDQCTPRLGTRVAGSIPRLRTTCAHMSSKETSNTTRSSTGASSQAPSASSFSSWPGPQPA